MTFPPRTHGAILPSDRYNQPGAIHPRLGSQTSPWVPLEAPPYPRGAASRIFHINAVFFVDIDRSRAIVEHLMVGGIRRFLSVLARLTSVLKCGSFVVPACWASTALPLRRCHQPPLVGCAVASEGSRARVDMSACLGPPPPSRVDWYDSELARWRRER